MATASLSILGSTGSIGTQALDVCRTLGLTVAALSANRNVGLLENQARCHSPKVVCLMDEKAAADLRVRLADMPVRVTSGLEGLCQIAAEMGDMVLNSVVGMVGLAPTLSALKSGKTVALANKETLVAAGELVMHTAVQYGAKLLPVDSEHSAIFQCLQGNDKRDMDHILLTASGGPFLGRTREELYGVSREEALRHPNWSMGPKITVDSATLMNKGLELIEAMWLFGVEPEQIEILIHPESIVHSAVAYRDGAVMAQLGAPDMRLAIQYALTYPRRVSGPVKPLDLTALGALTFRHPDEETFGCLAAAKEAARRGGLAPCVVNAANEAAVALFLEGKIGFLGIEERVWGALEAVPAPGYSTLEEVWEAEQAARTYVLEGHVGSGR